MIFTSKTQSPKETEDLAKRIAPCLGCGSIVALTGEWGAGKTVFTKGLMTGLGVKSKREVKSPSFVILKHYEGKCPCHHLDLYRLDGIQDLEAIGFEEFVFSDGITVIEWADRIKGHLPKDCLAVQIDISGQMSRAFKFSSADENLVKRVRSYAKTQ